MAEILAQATEAYNAFFDVSTYALSDQSRAAAINKKAVECDAAIESTAAANAVAVAQLAADRAELLQRSEDDADVAIDRIDAKSVGKMVYEQFADQAAEQAHEVSVLAGRELQSYGYQSKMVASLGISVGALRAAMASGAPFRRQLAAVCSELDDDAMRPVTAPLEDAAGKGLPTAVATELAALDVATALDVARVAANAAPQVTEPPSNWDVLRFVRQKPEDPAIARRREEVAADDMVRLARSGEYAAALRACDSLVEPAAGIAAPQVAAFRAAAQQRLVADSVLRYFDATLAVKRFTFVEAMFAPPPTKGDA